MTCLTRSEQRHCHKHSKRPRKCCRADRRAIKNLARQSRILDQADRASTVSANESPITEKFEGFTDEDDPGSPAMDEDFQDEDFQDEPSASLFAPINDDIGQPRPDPLPPHSVPFIY